MDVILFFIGKKLIIIGSKEVRNNPYKKRREIVPCVVHNEKSMTRCGTISHELV